MRLFRPLTLLCLLGALLFSSCNSYKIRDDLHASIVGIWKGDNSSALLTIFGDGRFILRNAAGAEGEILGTIERGRDMILFNYSSPSALCPGARGVYRFSRKGDVLTLETVNEECPERARQIDASWTMKSPIPE